MWWMGWPHRWWDEIPYFDGEITTFDYPSTLNSISLDFHHQKHWISPSKNLGDILNSLHFHHLRSLFRTSLGGSATAGLALFHALRRRTKHRAAARLTRRSAAQPIFCSALSSQGDWRAAVAELVAEATYQLLEEKWWNDEENCWKMMVKMWYFFLYLGGSRPCKRDGWDEYYVWDGLKATNRGWKLRGSKLRFTWYKMPIRFRSLVDHDWREKLIIFLEVDIIFLHLLGVVMHDKNDEKMLLR